MYKIKESPEDFVVDEITNIKLQDNGDYSVFLLKKINKTTEEAIQAIADKLNIPRKFIGYAGNKDKIAVTAQYISIKGTHIKELKLSDIELEFKGYLERPISLGDLEGNEFKIRVITDKEPKKIKKMINCFGEQRFSKNNKDVGKAIVLKNFKKAVELILENKGRQENAVLDYLKDHKTDYIGALRKLPMKILIMYIHSYQSYIWNIMAEIESKNKKPCEKVPLIGFGTTETKEMSKILKKEGIVSRDFIIRPIPELTQEGSLRDLFVEIKKLKMNKEKEGYLVTFILPKGAYATEVIKQIFS